MKPTVTITMPYYDMTTTYCKQLSNKYGPGKYSIPLKLPCLQIFVLFKYGFHLMFVN